MLRFAANLAMMYREHEFFDRFAAAAQDGFTAVEYPLPFDYPLEKQRSLLEQNGLRLVLFNAPFGDAAAGERGLASLPGREKEFREGFERALEYAQALRCPHVHPMAGLLPSEGDRARFRAKYLENLAWAADKAKPAGVDVLVEPIAQCNVPGFFVSRQEVGYEIVTELGKPNVKILLDLFHCQMEQGNLAVKLRKYLGEKPSRLGHMQIAGVPERQEPNIGEVNYAYLFDLVEELGYEGWIGCEYVPKAGTSEGLGWMRTLVTQRETARA